MKAMKNRENQLIEIFAGSYLEVEIFTSILKDSEIESFLKDENIGTIAPWQAASGGAGAVKVMISSSDLSLAKELLEEFKKNRK